MIPLRGRGVSQRLVGTEVIVVFEPPAQPTARRQPIPVILQVDVLLLHAAPQPFAEPVVQPAPTPADSTASMYASLVNSLP